MGCAHGLPVHQGVPGNLTVELVPTARVVIVFVHTAGHTVVGYV